MLLLLAALVFLPSQNLALDPDQPTPSDRVVQIEITADDALLIDGKGPTAVVDYEVEFEGTLHVWTQSELDLFLRVERISDGMVLAEDDDSGGGQTPYLELAVKEGDYLAVLVASSREEIGELDLHLVAAPETEATREAVRASYAALAQVEQLRAAGEHAAARELLARALETWTHDHGSRTTPADPPDVLRAKVNLANSMQAMGEFAGARSLREAVVEGYERTLPADHPKLLSGKHNLAILMSAMGEVAEARALQEAVLAGRERTLPADHPDLLLAKNNLAMSMHEMGELADARALLEAVLECYERVRPADHFDLLPAKGNLANTMHAMGDLAGARALREAVLAGCERTLPADHLYLLRAKNNLAGSMREMGDLAGACALFEAVLAEYERTRPPDDRDLLGAKHNLATSMQAMGELAGARELQEAVLAGIERTVPADHPDLLNAKNSLAISMHKMGDLAGARALFEAVIAQQERALPADHPSLLGSKHNLAKTMRATGDLADACALMESVLAGRERSLPVGHPDRLRAEGELAGSSYERGDLDRARALVPSLADGVRARALASLALAPRQALATVAASSTYVSAVVFLSESADPSLQTIAFEVVETLRLVAGEAARSLASFEADPELFPLLARAASIRSSLNDLVAGSTRDAESREELAEEFTRLTLERDALEREASRLLVERGVVARAIESRALAAALDAGEAVIGYRRLARWEGVDAGEDRFIAHVLTPGGTLTRVDLGAAAELEQLVVAWRNALGAPVLRGVPVAEGVDTEGSAGRALRRRLLDPVLAAAGEKVSRLIVCADDLAFLVPLDALPLEEGDEVERLGDRCQIINEVSFARTLSPAAATGAAPSLLALGGVDYDAEGSMPGGLTASSAPIERGYGGDTERAGDQEASTRSALPDRFQALLQSRFEAEATAALFEEAFDIDPMLLTKKGTTKAALFGAAPGKRYLHIATHGWFAPESVKSIADSAPADSTRMSLEERLIGLAPMTLCGLALAGANRGRDSLGRVPGILTAEELCSLDLSRCELAVLSACETNVGIRRAGQGIQSLQAALYAAGARTSITSLWRVDDAATRRLFEAFYTKLWIEKEPRAEALWAAKKVLRDEGHGPADWAAWVLTGDPD